MSLLERVRRGLLGLDGGWEPPGPARSHPVQAAPVSGARAASAAPAAVGSGWGVAPVVPASPSGGDLAAILAPLARRLRVARPELWAPAEVNEPSPDVVSTAVLPVVGVVS